MCSSDLTVGASGIVTTDNNRSVSVTTAGLIVSIANSGVNLGSGTFTLTVPSGTILSGSSADDTANITAGTLTVTDGTAFGATGGNGALDVNVTTASITGVSGAILVDAVGAGGLDRKGVV